MKETGILQASCREIIDRLKSRDIFYDAMVASVESAIRDYIAKTHDDGSSYHELAEFIIKRVIGEC